MKSIAIVVLFMNEFGKKGFYQSQEIGLANAFYEAGWDVEIFRCIPGESYEEGDRYPIHYRKVKKFGSHALFNPKKFFHRKFDFMAAFCDTELIVPKLSKYCHKNGITFIPYVGATESVSFSQKFKKTVMDFVYKHNTLKTYINDSQYIFCKNHDTMKRLVEKGVPEDKLVFSPVGMNISMLHQNYSFDDLKKLRKNNGYDPDDKVILFVGRLNNEKRPLDTFKILDLLNDNSYKLIIIGDGFLKEDVQKKTAEYGSRVQYYDKVPYDQMWKYYAMADYFINLWNEEVFGMAILEAIFYLTPAFLISAPGPRVIAKDLSNSYICENIEEIVKKIKGYQYNAQSLEKDKLLLISQFSWDSFVGNVERVFGTEKEA